MSSKPDTLDRRLAILSQFRCQEFLDQIAGLDDTITAKLEEKLFLDGQLTAAKSARAETETEVKKIAAFTGKNAEERRANQETALATDPDVRLKIHQEADVAHQVALLTNEITGLQRRTRRLYATVETRAAALHFLSAPVTMTETPA